MLYLRVQSMNKFYIYFSFIFILLLSCNKDDDDNTIVIRDYSEQVVDDAIESGFNAAGQRCSALRILAIQEEVYDKTIEMLIGATCPGCMSSKW